MSEHDWHGDGAGSICTRCGLRWIGGGFLGLDGTHYHARDEPPCTESVDPGPDSAAGPDQRARPYSDNRVK